MMNFEKNENSSSCVNIGRMFYIIPPNKVANIFLQYIIAKYCKYSSIQNYKGTLSFRRFFVELGGVVPMSGKLNTTTA